MYKIQRITKSHKALLIQWYFTKKSKHKCTVLDNYIFDIGNLNGSRLKKPDPNQN